MSSSLSVFFFFPRRKWMQDLRSTSTLTRTLKVCPDHRNLPVWRGYRYHTIGFHFRLTSGIPGIFSVTNSRPTERGASKSPPAFINICQNNGATNIKLSVLFGTSILHHICKQKFRTYHRLAGNDVRVTPCSEYFNVKSGSRRIALLYPVFSPRRASARRRKRRAGGV